MEYTASDAGVYEAEVLLTYQHGAGLVDPPPVRQYVLHPLAVVVFVCNIFVSLTYRY